MGAFSARTHCKYLPLEATYIQEVMRLNKLTQEISLVCRDHLLEEKWLIAPSLRVGHQWLDNVALNGRPVVEREGENVEEYGPGTGRT